MSRPTPRPGAAAGAGAALTIDAATGRLLVERPEHLPRVLLGTLERLVGPGEMIACAAPTVVLALPPATPDELAGGPCVRMAGYWHDSLIEGPGRRSTAKLQGCPLRCRGCVTPDSWDPAGGFVVPVDRLAAALLDPGYGRDGVTILGGEPFAQPDGLLALVGALRARGCGHILCYSGYTYDALRHLAERQPAVGDVLAEIDMLVDGPYVATLAGGAGAWTGSGNQRVLALKGGAATRCPTPGAST